MLMILSSSTSALSATTEEKLNACDAALYAKVKEADLCNLGVQLRSNELERISKENTQLRERGTGLFDNPFVWAAVGVIAGAYIGESVEDHH